MERWNSSKSQPSINMKHCNLRAITEVFVIGPWLIPAPASRHINIFHIQNLPPLIYVEHCHNHTFTLNTLGLMNSVVVCWNKPRNGSWREDRERKVIRHMKEPVYLKGRQESSALVWSAASVPGVWSGDGVRVHRLRLMQTGSCTSPRVITQTVRLSSTLNLSAIKCGTMPKSDSTRLPCRASFSYEGKCRTTELRSKS